MESIRRGVRFLPASYRGSLPWGGPNVAITFDDAYVSVAENALPELLAREFHSTVFVPVDSLGSRPTWPVEDGSLDVDETVMSAERMMAQALPLPRPVMLLIHRNAPPVSPE